MRRSSARLMPPPESRQQQAAQRTTGSLPHPARPRLLRRRRHGTQREHGGTSARHPKPAPGGPATATAPARALRVFRPSQDIPSSVGARTNDLTTMMSQSTSTQRVRGGK